MIQEAYVQGIENRRSKAFSHPCAHSKINPQSNRDFPPHPILAILASLDKGEDTDEANAGKLYIDRLIALGLEVRTAKCFVRLKGRRRVGLMEKEEAQGSDTEQPETSPSTPNARKKLFPTLLGLLNRKKSVIQQNKRFRRFIVTGPNRSGKSTLLRTLWITERGIRHSYNSVSASLMPTDPIDEWALLESGFASCNTPVPTTWTFSGNGERMTFEIEEFPLATPVDSSSLAGRMHEAGNMILCLPTRGLSNQPQPALQDFEKTVFSQLATFELDGVTRPRIVVCCTKYERTFLKYGADAVHHACDPDAAKGILRETIHRAGIEDRLNTLAARGWDIICQPVSSYGFVLGNGAANYDPRNDAEDGAQASGALLTRPRMWPTNVDTASRRIFDRSEISELWAPFLTLDPFLHIMFEAPQGPLTFRLPELAAMSRGRN